MNKVLLVGRLGRDAETQTFDSGKRLTKFTLATAKKYGDKLPTWHNIELWTSKESSLHNYLKKGTTVSIDGEINYNTYEKDGIKRIFTSIKCDNLELLDSRRVDEDTTSSFDESNPSKADNPVQSTFQKEEEDELPF